AQSSRVPVPLPDDPCIAVRQARLVDTELEPEEAPSKVDELQSLGSRVPLRGEEFVVVEPSCTRTDSSHSSASSDSTAPLSPDHPLTHVLPTLTPTRVSFHRRTTRMTVRVQPAMSPSLSSSIAEVAVMSDSAFRKRFRSPYDSSPSPTLPVRKRYRGTSELILDTDSDEDTLGDEDTDEDEEDESLDADDEREGLDDEDRGLDDEDHSLDDEDRRLDDEDRGLGDEGRSLDEEGLGLERSEEEAVLEGQQRAASIVETVVGEPLGLGYEALRHRELAAKEVQIRNTFEVGQGSGSVPEPERPERMLALRQPTLTTWTDPKDGKTYTDIPTYPPLPPPVQTPPSPEWSSGSLPVSPSPSVVPLPISSPLISLTVPSPIASPAATLTATISVDED
ncbi:hypothetical protein Tco_1299029, partial [Tanacetum coccineum]